jgi:hypothetical protein
VIAAERDALEEKFTAQVQDWTDYSIEMCAEITQACFNEVEHAEAKWLSQIVELPIENRRPVLDRIAWHNFDRQAQRPHSSRDQLAAYPHKKTRAQKLYHRDAIMD